MKNLAPQIPRVVHNNIFFHWVSVLTLTKSFARRTHIHACTPTYIYRVIHTFMYKTSHPHYSINHRQWKNDIHSFIQDVFVAPFKSTTTRRRSRPQQLTLCRSLYVEALQATVSEGLAQGPWRGGYSGIRTHDLPVQRQPIYHHAPRILMGNRKKNYQMNQCDCNMIVVS